MESRVVMETALGTACNAYCLGAGMQKGMVMGEVAGWEKTLSRSLAQGRRVGKTP